MSITLLRHAPLPIENQHKYNGWNDIHIDKTLFDDSKVKELKEKNFDLIYSSDLIRCQETLELIFEKRRIVTTKALREVQFNNEIEGKSFEEVERLSSFKKEYLKNEATWHKYICKEHQEDFNQRLKSFLEKLPQHKNILICSHAGAIKEMLSILKAPQKSLKYLEYYNL